jgi:hypothetical protein
MLRNTVLIAVLFSLTGCASMVVKQLQTVSAGYTGCLPDANEISNVNHSLDGSGTWNATCQGNVYLCSAAAAAGSNSESYHCAPAVK